MSKKYKKNYYDNNERRACLKKWNTLQIIWTVYNSGNRPDELKIPEEKLIVGNTSIHDVPNIIQGLKDRNCFSSYSRIKKKYSLKQINHKKLSIEYKLTEKEYDKFGKAFEEKQKAKQKIFILKARDGTKLTFNRVTGDFKFGKIEGKFNPETQKYKVFLCFMIKPSHIVKYKTLLKEMYPGIEFKGYLKEYQVERMALETVIRNIKRDLGILPKAKSINKDIFNTHKQQKAYRLLLD